MRTYFRPFLLVTIVSFLLGLWLSLRRGEQDLLRQLRRPPPLTILTDQPVWWSAVVAAAARDGIVDLRLLSPPRRRWEEILRASRADCQLVTLKSYFLSHFLSNRWLETVPEGQLRWWELLHPDFRDLPDISRPGQFLPLLWGVTGLDQPAEGSSGRIELKSSFDDALFLALELQEAESEFETDGTLDADQSAESLWQKAQDDLSLSIGQPETHIPLAPVKGVQRVITQADNGDSGTATNSQRLWTWGVGVCPGHRQSAAVNEFLDWLTEPEQASLLARAATLGLPFMSADHRGDPRLRPSNLRGFPLAKLKRAALPWDLAAAWEDLLLRRPEQPASR